jgi:hypothetical protein
VRDGSGSGRIRKASRRWAVLLAASACTLVPSLITPPASTAQPAAGTVTMTVLEVTPSTPSITAKPEPLHVQLSLTNTTDAELAGVTITGVRAAPLTSPDALDAALADPQAPQSSALDITTARPVRVSLPAGATRTVTFTTSTSTLDGEAGICICTSAGVYPLYFTAAVDGTEVGAVQTYLPAFYTPPKPLRIAWVWPLIDRPHRLSSDNVYIDDDLAASVSGGRLDRSLEAVEALVAASPDVALTLVVDPELLDELQVMSLGPYRVQPPGRPATTGTGTDAAGIWLGRLRTVLGADPAIQLALTPPDDPDYEQLTQAGLSWTAGLPAAVQARVATALGATLPTGRLAWPVSGALHADTLTSMARRGVSSVVLGSTALRTASAPDDGSPATLATADGKVQVLPTATDVATPVSEAVLVGGAGAAALPQLMAQLAVRVAQDPAARHQIVLVPPRLVDPDPQAAARTIAATTGAFWTTPAAVADLGAGANLPARVLASPARSAPHLPAPIVSGAAHVADVEPALASLLGAANPIVVALPVALQRAVAGSWASSRSAGEAVIAALLQSTAKVEEGVFIVKPSSGTYTLASNSSPLPLTVENDLDYPVHVVIHVEAANGLPGFHATDVSTTVDPHTKTAIRNLKATLERAGRIQVRVALMTRSGAVVGAPVQLSVRTTALGLIGIIITIVSGAVLLIALLRQFWLRYRRRGVPPTVPDEPVTAGVA